MSLGFASGVYEVEVNQGNISMTINNDALDAPLMPHVHLGCRKKVGVGGWPDMPETLGKSMQWMDVEEVCLFVSCFL